jgi:hypothetical protein
MVRTSIEKTSIHPSPKGRPDEEIVMNRTFVSVLAAVALGVVFAGPMGCSSEAGTGAEDGGY